MALIADNRPLFGLFGCLPAFQATEVLADVPMDFVVLEAEHGATHLSVLHAQTAAMAGSGIPVVVRVPTLDWIKPVLDLGVDGLMLPNVESAEQARAIVAATRYPPRGVRGIGGSVRATRFGRDSGYYRDAEPNLSVWAQIESPAGLANLEAIAAVDGIDVIFFGPQDLAAQMGHPGEPAHPEVQAAIEDGTRRALRAGVKAGCLTAEADCARWCSFGATVFLVGSDISLLVRAADGLMQRLRARFPAQPDPVLAP
ncbi:MAG TPA: aldolase/citrate lyase family protein [Hyphomicrobiales bacterium]|nr:aldolase/citrate lyase family protein [Hyphomicrobiales bacterium]